MSLKGIIEDTLDDLIGRRARKWLEQAAHAALGGIPAFLAVNWLPLGFWPSVGLAVALAALIGAVLEYLQNAGDERDQTTLFVVARVPINGDLLLDMAAYVAGGAVAGFIAGV
jgi:hypothetical protein